MRFRFAKCACYRLTEVADFGKKKIIFSDEVLILACKQAKLQHLGHRKPACIHWKPDAPKTCHCLVRILVQRHNWEIFLRKWVRRGPLQSMAIVIGTCWRNFCSQKLKRRILVTFGRCYVPHSRSCTRRFAPCFLRSHYQPQTWCRLATSELRSDYVCMYVSRIYKFLK